MELGSRFELLRIYTDAGGSGYGLL